jgi:sugar (pentulose or hexulose) kinase
MLTLGIDLGTSGVKAALLDDEDRVSRPRASR